MIYLYSRILCAAALSVKSKNSVDKGKNTMKKIICKVEYDTEASTLVAKYTEGSFGVPAGFEETLYVTEGGKYFLYVNGGEESIHAKEDIKRVSAAKAEEWKAEHNL